METGYGYDQFGAPQYGAPYQPQQQQHQMTPMPQQQQTVVIAMQPQAMTTTMQQPQNIREWSTGLCGCCEDCCSCAYAFFCHPCFMCTLATRMDECCTGPCFCGRLFEVPMRTKLRTMFGIRGSILKDCCAVTWCNFCATHQMYRELNNSGYRL